MRKPLQRSAKPRPKNRVTPGQVRVWLDERFTAEPDLRGRIARVLAALQKAESASRPRRRRAG